MPVTRVEFEHWLRIAVMGNASPGSPVIVPNDPPRFSGCIAQVRARIPSLAHSSTATIRRDCRELFASLVGQVLDYLIKADWYQEDAEINHIVITDAQVAQTFAADKRQLFPTASSYRTFLRLTGQTTQDLLFRVRVSLIYKALVNETHGHPQVLDQQAKKQFGPSTICARYYVIADCAGYRPDSATA